MIARNVLLSNIDEEIELARLSVHSKILEDCIEAKADLFGDDLYKMITPPVWERENPLGW